MQGTLIIRSYHLANEQLILFITRQQNDINRIIGAVGVNDLVVKNNR